MARGITQWRDVLTVKRFASHTTQIYSCMPDKRRHAPRWEKQNTIQIQKRKRKKEREMFNCLERGIEPKERFKTWNERKVYDTMRAQVSRPSWCVVLTWTYEESKKVRNAKNVAFFHIIHWNEIRMGGKYVNERKRCRFCVFLLLFSFDKQSYFVGYVIIIISLSFLCVDRKADDAKWNRNFGSVAFCIVKFVCLFGCGNGTFLSCCCSRLGQFNDYFIKRFFAALFSSSTSLSLPLLWSVAPVFRCCAICFSFITIIDVFIESETCFEWD